MLLFSKQLNEAADDLVGLIADLDKGIENSQGRLAEVETSRTVQQRTEFP
jgi:hypothetical protein